MRKLTLATLVALAVAFTLPTASLAAPGPLSGDWMGPSVLLDALQGWAANLWTQGVKDGFMMDPNGAPTADTGDDEAQLNIDPDGSPLDDAAGLVDPDGASGD